MKRERCIAKAIERMEARRIQKELIASIPINVPIIMSYRCPIRRLTWKWLPINIVCEIFDFNSLSFRATMIAVEDAEAYPFDQDLTRRAQNRIPCIIHPLGFSKIETWEIYKDLPLLLGWPNQYPRLAELLKT